MYQNFREALDPEAPAEDLIPRYKELVHALPDNNQYLLLYVLDLLHVFAKNSDKNLMTAASESMRGGGRACMERRLVQTSTSAR
jgi:hypothetical protein